MQTFTALFDRRADAEAAQARLEDLGIIDIDDRRVADGTSDALWSEGRGFAPPEPDRRLYEEGVKRGGALLTVNADDASAARVQAFLDETNAVDVEVRGQEYRDAGILPAAAPNSAGEATDFEGEARIPIVQETLRVGKRQVASGGVRVHSYVQERPVEEQVSLREEHITLDRHPVDPTVGVSADALRERTIDMTETAEEAVVSKAARVVEEVVVHKDVSERVETVNDTVRHTEVDVDRDDAVRTDRI